MANRRRAAPRKASTTWATGASRRKYIERALRECHDDIASAREDANWTAVAALRLRAQAARDELDALIKAEAAPAETDPIEGLTDDEVRDALLEVIRELPEGVVIEIAEAIEARRTGRPLLRVAES